MLSITFIFMKLRTIFAQQLAKNKSFYLDFYKYYCAFHKFIPYLHL
nr:MAG TPA: hypothetical protein [Caudoviricetes sp.]